MFRRLKRMNCFLLSFRLIFTWINLQLFNNLSDGFKWISRPSITTLGHVGSTVHITWHYEICTRRIGPSKISYNGKKIFSRYQKENNYSVIENIDAHFSVIGKSNVTIIIPDVDKDKRGSYCCEVDCNGQVPTACTMLVIYALPRINYLTSNRYGKQGDAITLKCNASGDPAPRVRWIHKDTNRIIANSSVTSFNITGKAYGGKYCCHVSNEYGTGINCASLEVTEYQPINTELTTNVKFAVRSMTFRVSCKADASPPANYFIKQGTKTLVNSSDGNVTITTPDNGTSLNISCVAKNKYGEGIVAYLQLLICQPPTIVTHWNTSITTKTNITFKCEAKGIPRPNITWHNATNNEVIYGANGTLQVKNKECKNETLKYYCRAWNIAGKDNTSLTVKSISFCENSEDNGDDTQPDLPSDNLLHNQLIIIIVVVIVCTLVTLALILFFILISRKRKHSKREIRGTKRQERRSRNELVEESPYGEPVDAIRVQSGTYASASNADYATVEETGYKRVITNHVPEPQHDKTSSSKKGKPYVEPVYAKVNKRKKKKDKSPDVPMNPLYDEIPGNIPNSKHPPTPLVTQPNPETSANNKNINEEEDEVDSGQGSWFSWPY